MKPVRPSSALKGSERKLPVGARYVGAADPNEQIEVSLYLRPRTSIQKTLRAQAGSGRHITREEYADLHGAAPEDIAQVEEFAAEHGLRVLSRDVTSRRLVLAGSVAAMSSAFAVELAVYQLEGRTFRGRVGALHLPAPLLAVVDSVHGLDDRSQAKPHFRTRTSTEPRLDPSQGQVYTPPQVARLYDFPTEGDGAGQCIAIIELGGGYQQADLDTYFGELQLRSPRVSSISVDGGTNSPAGDPNSADAEVMLDIEVAGSVAPGASIAVYFAPNTDQGFIDAVNTAVFDTVNKPSVVSISWGKAELYWTAQSMQTMDQVFQSAAALGVTVCVATGDDGTSDGVGDGNAHVDFPSSSPFALACGGTTLVSSQGAITSETVWNEPNNGSTGGGISDFFDLPSYQKGFSVPPSANAGKRIGRGIPDVSANADPLTGYLVRVDGIEGAIGGTSAAAPLWAGFIALLNQQLVTPIGHLNPLLYQDLINEAEVVRDIVSGDIGAYVAGPGWDACTGLGSFGDGEAWLAALIY
jgi:kumamolisin